MADESAQPDSATSYSEHQGRLVHELQRLLQHAVGSGVDEPEFRYHYETADDVFREFAARKAEVIYYSFPPNVDAAKNKIQSLLCDGLLEAMGKPVTPKQDKFVKQMRLEEAISELGIRMLIITGIHNLVSKHKKPLLHEFYWMFSFLKSRVMSENTSVVFSGEQAVCEPLIMQDGSMIRRFRELVSTE